MTGKDPRRREGRAIAAIVSIAALLAAGCSAPLGQRDRTPAAASRDPAGRVDTLDHLVPARDFVGAAPTRFEWTRVEGADAYAIGVWNEVDVLMWRADDVSEPSVAWPAEIRLEPGTYFWSVTALRGRQPVAESGLSAFVVR